MENDPILIICTSFPPFPGIGGRRWAKLAKYIAQSGKTCHVINGFNFSSSESLWTKDVQSNNIIVHSLKFKLQFWTGNYGKNLFYRIVAKIVRTLINYTKYSPYFSSSISKKKLQNKCISLIKNFNIKTVIASGDPYLHYYATQLKETHTIRVILDYRDTWNDRPYYNQNRFHKLKAKQRSYFEFCEKEALKNCDDVVCVYEPMIELLAKRGNKETSHFHLIPNGFDTDDFPKIKNGSAPGTKLKLYFGGNISPGDIADYFIHFLQAYSSLQYTDSQLWERFAIEIDSNYHPSFGEAIKKLNDPHIRLTSGLLSNESYRDNLMNAHYGILPLNSDYSDSLFITKTFDYLYLEKPIIYLGKQGKVSEFIEKNQIGFAFKEGIQPESFFKQLLEYASQIHYSDNLKKLIDKNYNLKNLSLAYIDLINQGIAHS